MQTQWATVVEQCISVCTYIYAMLYMLHKFKVKVFQQSKIQYMEHLPQ